MPLLNPSGKGFAALTIAPNVVLALKCGEGFGNTRRGKAAKTTGNLDSRAVWLHRLHGFQPASGRASALCLAVGSAPALSCRAVRAVRFHRKSLHRAICLSPTPSALFLFSGATGVRSPLQPRPRCPHSAMPRFPRRTVRPRPGIDAGPPPLTQPARAPFLKGREATPNPHRGILKSH